MKIKYIILTIFLSMVYQANAQISDIISKYSAMQHVTSINISSKMFELIGSKAFNNSVKMKGLGQKEISDCNLFDKMTSLQLISISDKKIGISFARDLQKEVKNGYEILMEINDDDSNVIFYGKMKGEDINELVMWGISKTDTDYTLICLKGIFSIEDLKKMQGNQK